MMKIESYGHWPRTADVAVLGRGPAGYVAAVTAARAGARVLSLAGPARPAHERGETLPPIARKVLASLGMLDRITRAQLTLYSVNSAWGTPDLIERHSMASISGEGWLINRQTLEAGLEADLELHGVTRLDMTGLKSARRSGGIWHFTANAIGREFEVRAGAVIDASGRAAIFARHVGAKRIVDDRLVAIVAHLGAAPSMSATGSIMIEAVPYGWWYAVVDADGLLVALMTDSDVCRSLGAHNKQHWSRLLDGTKHICRLIQVAPEPEAVTVVAANSSRLATPMGEGWIAAGDAAMAFDPISSQGIMVALMTGHKAAMAVLNESAHRPHQHGYSQFVDRILRDYHAGLHAHYAANDQWPDCAFWRRRSPVTALLS